MKFEDYNSVTHTTCNDNAREEISVEFEKTILQRLFKKPAKVLTYEMVCGKWVEKHTGRQTSWYEAECIDQLKFKLKCMGLISLYD